MQGLKKQAQLTLFEKNKNDSANYEKEIRALKMNIRMLENENLSLTNTLADQKLKISDYEEMEARLKEQIRGLQEDSNLRNQQLSKFEADNLKTLKSKIQEQQKYVSLLKQELEDLQQENENFKNENSKFLLSEDYYKQEIAKYQKQNKERQVKIKELENQIEVFHQEKLEMSRLRIELQSLKSAKNYEVDNDYIKELKSEIEALNQEIEDMAKELESSKQIYGTLLTLLKIKNSELEILKESCEDPERLTQFKEEESNLLIQYSLFRLETQTKSLNNYSDED